MSNREPKPSTPKQVGYLQSLSVPRAESEAIAAHVFRLPVDERLEEFDRATAAHDWADKQLQEHEDCASRGCVDCQGLGQVFKEVTS